MKALFALLALVPVALHAAGEGWTDDFAAAKKQAAEEDKSLLMDFTGSDWCGWCIRLDEEVFQHDEFKEGVADKLVLVELDFPRDASKLSEETQAQNEKLQQEYQVQGFPTIYLTDAKGRPFARTGYREGGPEAYLKHLDEMLALRDERDAALAKAEEAEGVARAEALVSALRSMPLDPAILDQFYGDVVERIAAADPDDETGFRAEREQVAKFGRFQQQLQGFAQAGDHDAALQLVDETLASGDYAGEQQQQIALIRGVILAEKGDFDAAVKAVEKAREIAPDSEAAGQIDAFKAQLRQMQAQQAPAQPEG